MPDLNCVDPHVSASDGTVRRRCACWPYTHPAAYSECGALTYIAEYAVSGGWSKKPISYFGHMTELSDRERERERRKVNTA